MPRTGEGSFLSSGKKEGKNGNLEIWVQIKVEEPQEGKKELWGPPISSNAAISYLGYLALGNHANLISYYLIFPGPARPWAPYGNLGTVC